MVDYDRAVELCRRHFAKVLDGEASYGITPFKGAPYESPIVIGPDAPPTEEQVRAAPQVWVNTAKTDPKAYEALLEAARRMWNNGRDLPRPVTDWLISLALGECEPPSGPTRDRTERVNGLIYHAVAALVILADFSETKNPILDPESSLDEKRSACDVVADAFAKLGPNKGQLPRRYERIRKIWHSAKNDHSFNPAEYRAFAATHRSGIWAALEQEG